MKKRDTRQNHVVIIGAGPAGLTAAYALSKAGVASTVLEKDQVVGGISRTVKYKGYYFDIGGHRFFTKVAAVEKIWKEVLVEDLISCNRLSRIYYNKKFFHYPLRPLNALMGLGIFNSALIVTSYLYAHFFPSKEEDTLEQWVTNRFGKRLFRIFFKTYTEKVWGMPCNEIRAEWAAQRIKGLSLLRALRNAMIGNQHRNRGDVIKTLIDRFEYPKLGPGMMWHRVSTLIEKNGSEVRLGSEVNSILWSNNRIDGLEINRNGEKEVIQGSHFISSMPLRELIQKLRPSVPVEVLAAANDLKYRDFLTVALIIRKGKLFPDNWIYVHDPDVKVGRIQNFKNWSPAMVPDENHTCLGLEYFCFEGDSLWASSDEELIELGRKELEKLGLGNDADIEDGVVVRMPKAYPIYDATYSSSLDVLRKFLGKMENLQTVGRNGMHRYNNQDHSMLTAMLAVENILGSQHDLWKVNVEEQYHEEVLAEIDLEKILSRLFSRMDKLGFATAIGSVSGLLILAATIFLTVRGKEIAGPALELLSQYFPGYSVDVGGALIGAANGFLWGFLFGWLFAYLRNFALAYHMYRLRRKLELLNFKDFLDHY